MNPNMLSPARTLSVSARLTFPTGTVAELDGGDILNFTIEEGADSALLPGAVLSSEVTLELANDAGQWNYGGSIRGERPLVGATVALFLCADTDALPCGVFIITSVRAQERSGKICLSGADSIPQELSLPFQDDLVYPATLESLWRHLVGQTRYVWSGSLPNGSAIVDAPPNWNGASLRRAAGWIAQAAGCFVRVDREGNLQILPCLGGEIHALTPEAYMSYTDGCASYGPVEALQVTPAGAEDSLTVSDGDGTGKTLSIQGNPLYQSEAPNLNALIDVYKRQPHRPRWKRRHKTPLRMPKAPRPWTPAGCGEACAPNVPEPARASALRVPMPPRWNSALPARPRGPFWPRQLHVSVQTSSVWPRNWHGKGSVEQRPPARCRCGMGKEQALPDTMGGGREPCR